MSNQTALVIVIFANGDRRLTEIPVPQTPRQWDKAMKDIGTKMIDEFLPAVNGGVASCLFICGNSEVSHYNGSEAAEVLGL